MARTQRPIALTRGISQRLLFTLQQDLGLTMTEAAHALGYSNPSTLHAVRHGKVLPDAGRLAQFASRHTDPLGRTVNLHWLLTGEGERFLSSADKPIEENSNVEVDFMNLVRRMDTASKEALVVLLSRRP